MFVGVLLQIVLACSLVVDARGDGFLKMGFSALRGDLAPAGFSHPLRRLLSRGMGSSPVQLTNERNFYVAELQVGSPGQTLQVVLDTASADLWVMLESNPQCQQNGGHIDCEQFGTFSANELSTLNRSSETFSLGYLDGTYSNGTWVADRVALGPEFNLSGARFAVATDTNSTVGVCGIGFAELESVQQKYANLPALLKERGYVATNCYSLYLTSAEAQYGSVLFGAYDEAKFEAPLKELAMNEKQGRYAFFEVTLGSVAVELGEEPLSASPSTKIAHVIPTGQPGNYSVASDIVAAVKDLGLHRRATRQSFDTNELSVIFDSGTTYSLLPANLTQQIAMAIDANSTFNPQMGMYSVDCALKLLSNTIVFTFEDKDIRIPLLNFVFQSGLNPATGKQLCSLGIVPAETFILGDNFLRSCYSLFNLDKKTISIAQVVYTDNERIQVVQA